MTRTAASLDSVIGNEHWNQPIGVVPVSAKIDELARSAAEDELSATSLAGSGPLVHDDVQIDHGSALNPRHPDRDRITVFGRHPRCAHRDSFSPPVDWPKAHGIGRRIRDE